MRPAAAPFLLPIALFAGLAVACGEPAPTGRVRIAWRLIEPAPVEIFDPASLARREAVFDWRFDDPQEWSRWAPRRRRPAGVAGTRSLVSWLRPVMIDTDAIDVVELVVSRPPDGMRFLLSWADRGQLFSPERTVEGHLLGPVRGARGRVRFALGAHPTWRGAVNRLQLRIRAPAESGDEARLLRGLVGYRVTPPSAEVRAESLERPWKVDLGGDLRDAMAIAPGRAREVPVAVPAGAWLRFGFGVDQAHARPLTVRVEALADASTDASVAGQARTLFSGRIDAGEIAWRSAAVDLSPLAGRRARLRFRAWDPAARSPAIDRPTVFWAHPEIVQPTVGAADTREAPPKPHVVLISLDTLRADRLSLYGHARDTSPRLDAWAGRHAGVFSNAVAPAPWTLPSHVSMLTGIDAHRHGVNHDGAVPASMPLLAERLRAAGYATVAITGGGFLDPRHGFARGFDRYLGWRPRADGADRYDELDAGVAAALAAIEQNQGEPLFLFFHTYEPHAPYLPREPYFTAFGGTAPAAGARLVNVTPTPADGFRSHSAPAMLADNGASEAVTEPLEEHIGRLYDSGVAYTDARIGRLLSRLERLADRRPTLVIVTSDHGEALGDGGRFGHHDLFDDTLLVPLLVRTPSGVGAGARIAHQVRTVDIVPTVLELAGLPADTTVDGRSLAGLLRGDRRPHRSSDVAWSYASNPNRGLALRRDNRLKYVWNPTAWAAVGGRERVIDLRRDPNERSDLAGSFDTGLLRAAALRALAAAPGLRVRLDGPAPGSPVPSLVGELRGPAIHPQRLEQLGAPCACVTWVADERTRFEVAAGQRVELLIEEVEAGVLGVAVTGDGGRLVATDLALDALDGPRVLSQRPGRPWAWDAPDGEDAAGRIAVWWQGRPTAAARAETADEALREALRALGYL